MIKGDFSSHGHREEWTLCFVSVSPSDMLAQSSLGGVQLAAERTFVLLFREGSIAGMLLLVNRQVGLGGVALKTDVTLEWFLPCVHSGVTLILPFQIQKHMH